MYAKGSTDLSVCRAQAQDPGPLTYESGALPTALRGQSILPLKQE